MINHPWQAAHEPLDMSAQGIMKLIQLIKDLTGQSQALEMPPPPPSPGLPQPQPAAPEANPLMRALLGR